MKRYQLRVLAIITLLCAGFFGCSKTSGPPSTTPSTSQGKSAIEPILSAWQEGKRSIAVQAFSETDWTLQPMFEPDSVLALSEQEYSALPASRRASEEGNMHATMRALKEIAAAVAQAGRDALAKGETVQAREYFDSLKQCGTALAVPDHLSLLQMHGKGMKKLADTELLKIPQ